MPTYCPYCGTEMIPGESFIRGTLFGFLLFGWSHQYLWFRREGERRKEVIIRTGDSRPGHQYPQCDAAIINQVRR